MPRLRIRLPVRAHSRTNQCIINKWNNKLVALSLSLTLSLLPPFSLSLKVISKKFQKSETIFFEVKFTWYKNNHFKMTDSVVLSAFTVLCHHLLYLVPKESHYSKWKLLSHEAAAPHWLSTPALVTTNLCSVCMNLSIVDISYECNHAICNLFGSAFFHLEPII